MQTIQQFLFHQLRSRSPLARYGFAILAILAVLLFRSVLHPVLGTRSQYMIFLLAVLATAWFSGSRPAVLALVCGAVLGNFFFGDPYFIFNFSSVSDALAALFYLIVGLTIIYLFEVVKRHEAKLAGQIRKQAEAENALRLSEERFRLATEALDGVIYDWDIPKNLIFRSNGLYDLLGFQPDEIPDDPRWWQARVNPDDLKKVQQSFARTLAERGPRQSDEYRIRHKEGHEIWVWDNYRLIYDDQGQPVRQLGSTISIDETKRLAESLAQSEERFRLASEALKGVIYDWDATTDTAYRSPGVYEMLGYQLSEVSQSRRWWQNQIHPDDSERVQQAIQESIANHAPIHSVEYRVRHKEGHYFWVWDNSRIIYDDQGKVTRLIGNTVSIDKQMRLADALSQTEERFRLAFENATDAMAISDRAGTVVEANQAYLQLYGYSVEEVIGKNFAIIYPEAERENSIKRYQQVFESTEDLPTYDSVVRRKDGTERIVEARVGFVEPNGHRLYMLSVVRDLTERRRTERELYTRYQLTNSLAEATTIEEVGQVTVDYLTNYLGAHVGNIYTYHADTNTVRLLYGNTTAYTDRFANWQEFPADDNLPLTDVVKHNQSLWFSSSDEWFAAYPAMKQFSSHDLGATIHLPLVAASEVFGAISLLFLENHSFTDSDKVYIASLVFQCAQAIERARLAENAKELAVIQERHRLARELHDNVSQLLFSSSVISEIMPRLLRNQPEKALSQAEQLNLMVRGAMAEMRSLLWELRPESIIQTQLSNLLTQHSYAIRARQEVEISVTVRADQEYRLPPDAQVSFYRIAQESVHNVIKHGQATEISILLRQTDRYTALIVMDNGRGFDTSAINEGFGLRNMRERAASIGAQFSIKSRIGKGTRLRLLLITQPTVETSSTPISNG